MINKKIPFFLGLLLSSAACANNNPAPCRASNEQPSMCPVVPASGLPVELPCISPDECPARVPAEPSVCSECPTPSMPDQCPARIPAEPSSVCPECCPMPSMPDECPAGIPVEPSISPECCPAPSMPDECPARTAVEPTVCPGMPYVMPDQSPCRTAVEPSIFMSTMLDKPEVRAAYDSFTPEEQEQFRSWLKDLEEVSMCTLGEMLESIEKNQAIFDRFKEHKNMDILEFFASVDLISTKAQPSMPDVPNSPEGILSSSEITQFMEMLSDKERTDFKQFIETLCSIPGNREPEVSAIFARYEPLLTKLKLNHGYTVCLSIGVKGSDAVVSYNMTA